MLKSEALYELGRYQKKCADQAKELAKYKEREEGFTQVIAANNALVCAVLMAVGADESNPISVTMEEVSEAIGGYDVVPLVDLEHRAYELFYRRTVSTDGGEESNGEPG